MESCCYSSITTSSSSSSSILNFQGVSFSADRRFCRTASVPRSHSCLLTKPFLQLSNNFQPLIYRQSSSYLSLRSYKGTISADAEKKGWDFGRFIKTLYFFNGPPSPAKFFDFLVEKLSGPSPSEPVKSMDTSGIVLVAGATGGVGRRVVDVLRKKGLPVRVLVRNEEKARRMLGPDVDMIVGDITKASTLLPEYFKGVKKVINAVSVIVGPKEGDTPDRAKYSQGIKFFEPEIKGDSPEMVEYVGIKNLINAVKGSVALRSGKLVYGFEGDSSRDLPWGALDDVVMGGVSESAFRVDPTGGENGGYTGLFTGVVSTANNGGFTSIRTKGEDLIRESGIPYTIVRPCALTKEPAGADLIFEQGDNITGKISREEVALICVAALESANACDKTFEVKSVIPFSEPFTVDPENPPPEKDYDKYFSTLKGGVTGKEALENSPVPV